MTFTDECCDALALQFCKLCETVKPVPLFRHVHSILNIVFVVSVGHAAFIMCDKVAVHDLF